MRRFVGSNKFCLKLCYNTITSPDYCLNVYDLIGCDYNMPSNVQNGTFTSCDGDLQDIVGVYTVNGVSKLLFLLLVTLVVSFLFLASTWSMPATLVAPPPYQPRVPASSNCQTFQATDLFSFTSTVSFSFTQTPSLYYRVLLILTPFSHPRPQGQPRPLVPNHPARVVQALALGAVLLQQAQVNLQPLAR